MGSQLLNRCVYGGRLWTCVDGRLYVPVVILATFLANRARREQREAIRQTKQSTKTAKITEPCTIYEVMLPKEVKQVFYQNDKK